MKKILLIIVIMTIVVFTSSFADGLEGLYYNELSNPEILGRGLTDAYYFFSNYTYNYVFLVPENNPKNLKVDIRHSGKYRITDDRFIIEIYKIHYFYEGNEVDFYELPHIQEFELLYKDEKTLNFIYIPLPEENEDDYEEVVYIKHES